MSSASPSRVSPLVRLLFNKFDYADPNQKTLGPPGPFQVEDAKPNDVADWMFTIRVTVTEFDWLQIRIGNCPTDAHVRTYLAELFDCRLPDLPYQDVAFQLRAQEAHLLGGLAEEVRGMLKRPYEYRNYRWQCPRLAKCLKRLEKVLDRFNRKHGGDED